MKILIIGLGSIATKHIDALREINPDIKVFALRSNKEAKKVDGVVNIYSYSEIESLDVDFAIVSNPTFSHKETIESLIPYNIPLFIEKPLFSKLDDDKLLLDKIRGENLSNYVACNLRFLDCIKFVKKYISNKKINEVNLYCGSYLPDWRPNKDYKKIYSANKELGGGVHIDLIHEIDYAYWLFGNPNKVRSTFSSKSTLNINSYDYANYLLIYSNYNVNITLNYYRRDPKRTLEILTENETITVDLLSNSVVVNSKLVFESDKRIKETYKEQLEFFINNVLTKKQKFNTVDEAYKILELCLQKN